MLKKIKNFKISKAVWSPLNDEIFALCADGTIRVLDVKKLIEKNLLHLIMVLTPKNQKMMNSCLI